VEIPSDINLGKVDVIGSHFKFKELFNKLRAIILSNLQEKRSKDLLQY
jgi:hypothetical protein